MKYKTSTCANCHKEFTHLRYIKRKTCSISCATRLSHKKKNYKIQEVEKLSAWQERIQRELHLETLIIEDICSEVL